MSPEVVKRAVPCVIRIPIISGRDAEREVRERCSVFQTVQGEARIRASKPLHSAVLSGRGTLVGVEPTRTLARIPNTMSQHAQAIPARRDAHRVSAMTPLFCEKVVLGMLVIKVDRKLEMPAPRRPPRILCEILERGGRTGHGQRQARHKTDATPHAAPAEGFRTVISCRWWRIETVKKSHREAPLALLGVLRS